MTKSSALEILRFVNLALNCILLPGWQKLRESAKDLRRKFLRSNIRYFVVIFRFVAIYAFWAKQVFLGGQNNVSWARSALLHGIYFILCCIEYANLQLRAKTTHLSRNCKYALDEHFLPSPKGCQLLPPWTVYVNM